jgi:hypothetical protein
MQVPFRPLAWLLMCLQGWQALTVAITTPGTTVVNKLVLWGYRDTLMQAKVQVLWQ